MKLFINKLFETFFIKFINELFEELNFKNTPN